MSYYRLLFGKTKNIRNMYYNFQYNEEKQLTNIY